MSDNKHKTLEENKAVIRRWLEVVWNQRRFELVDELIDDTFVGHYFAMPSMPLDANMYKQGPAMFISAFPDFHMTIDDLMADGDRVIARVTQQGTHMGELMGIPATGKVVTLPVIAIYRIANGKIVELWAAETPWLVVLTEAAMTVA